MTDRVRSARVPNKTGSGNGWRRRAACRDAEPELFFPIGNSGPALMQTEEAKKVCRSCPVITECLDWAMSVGEEYGVWGGLSEVERKSLKRRRQRLEARARAEAAAETEPVPEVEAPVVPAFKRCGNCDEVKPADDFPKARNRPDGLGGWCKDCKNGVRKEQRLEAAVA